VLDNASIFPHGLETLLLCGLSLGFYSTLG